MATDILLKLLEKIRLYLAFKKDGVIVSHWRWRLRGERLYRKYLKKLGIEKIEYEIEKNSRGGDAYCITIRFKNEDWVCLWSQDLMNVINQLRVILILHEEIKGVKK